MESFIGLYVTPGFALIDTGAQHGVIGKPDYQTLCERLAVQGLKPRILPTFNANAQGVGGTTTFVLSAELPIAIQGVNGVLPINVIDNPLPFLLPMSFCKKLGMVLDTVENTATWKHIGKVSEVIELPSEHIAIDILEFPPGGWTNPHEQQTALLFNRDGKRNLSIKRADFELPLPAAAPLLKHTLPSSKPSESSASVSAREDVQSSMPHSREQCNTNLQGRLAARPRRPTCQSHRGCPVGRVYF